MLRELQLCVLGRKLPIEFSDAGMDWAADRIRFLLGERIAKIMLITDEQIGLHYSLPLRRALEARGLQTIITSFPPGESEKTLRRVSDLLDKLVLNGFEKSDIIIGLGGGVVTDLAGFTAACYHRGMDWFALPTSLLGMIDAAIGGKTGVNHALGKNLIGTIHPAAAVIADVSTLTTLPERELLSASAEFVKHALLHGGKLWESVQEDGADLRLWDRELLYEMIPECAQVKIDVVEEDLTDSGRRMILNLGHTFGHAIESATDYSLSHGEAVFLGLRAMLRLSERCGLLDALKAMEIDEVLRKVHLKSAEMSPDDVLSFIRHDKKSREGRLNWVLLRDIGEPAITTRVSEIDVSETTEWLCEAAAIGGKPALQLPKRLKIAVFNGPNLNLLGTREPDIYGKHSYQELEDSIRDFAKENGLEVLIQQTNSESEMVTLLQSARHWADGIVINPGAYTHTSVAIRDAIATIGIPTIEVHLSDIESREDFRRGSLMKDVCIEQIKGRGIQGYFNAIDVFREHYYSITGKIPV
ncbi:3-dehydroquinate synthase [bacterium]|nr:3-dehydroquinate synthase [bacterium]